MCATRRRLESAQRVAKMMANVANDVSAVVVVAAAAVTQLLLLCGVPAAWEADKFAKMNTFPWAQQQIGRASCRARV